MSKFIVEYAFIDFVCKTIPKKVSQITVYCSNFLGYSMPVCIY